MLSNLLIRCDNITFNDDNLYREFTNADNRKMKKKAIKISFGIIEQKKND